MQWNWVLGPAQPDTRGRGWAGHHPGGDVGEVAPAVVSRAADGGPQA